MGLVSKGRCSLVVAIALLIAVTSMAAAQETVTLQWITEFTDRQRVIYEDAIRRFEEKFPHAKVDLIHPTGGWEGLWDHLVVSCAAGVPPDIVRGKDYFAQDLARMGCAMELDAYVERDYAELNIDPWYQDLIDAHRYQGRLYALPWHVYYYLTYYNVDIFNEAGLPGAPDTWDDVFDYGAKLTRPEAGFYATILMTDSGSDAFMAKTMEMFARQFAEDPFSEPWSVHEVLPTFNLEGRAMADAVQTWLDLIDLEIVKPPGVGGTLLDRAFWFSSAHGAVELRSLNPEINFELALMPRKENRATVVEQNAIIPLKSQNDPELVWELLKIVTDSETNVAYASDSVYLPNRMSDWHQYPFNVERDWMMAAEQLAREDAVFHREYPPEWFDLMIGISVPLAQILRGEISLTQGLRNAQQHVDNRLPVIRAILEK